MQTILPSFITNDTKLTMKQWFEICGYFWILVRYKNGDVACFYRKQTFVKQKSVASGSNRFGLLKTYTIDDILS